LNHAEKDFGAQKKKPKRKNDDYMNKLTTTPNFGKSYSFYERVLILPETPAKVKAGFAGKGTRSVHAHFFVSQKSERANISHTP